MTVRLKHLYLFFCYLTTLVVYTTYTVDSLKDITASFIAQYAAIKDISVIERIRKLPLELQEILLHELSNQNKLLILALFKPYTNPSVLQGHTEATYNPTWSTNGRYALSGSADTSACLWDTSNPDNITLSHTLRGHSDVVNKVALSSNDSYIITYCHDMLLYLWDRHDLENIPSVITLPSHCTAVLFSPDSSLFAVGCENGTIYIYNTSDPKKNPIIIAPPHNTKGITSLTFSPDGTTLISGDVNKFVYVWNVSNLDDITLSLQLPHNSHVMALAISPDGGYLAVGLANAPVCLYRISGNHYHPYTLTDITHNSTSLHFSTNNYLISGSWDNKIYLWNISCLHDIPLTIDAQKDTTIVNDTTNQDARDTNEIAIHPSGNYALSSSFDNVIYCWKLITPTLSLNQLEVILKLKQCKEQYDKLKTILDSAHYKATFSLSEQKLIHNYFIKAFESNSHSPYE